MVINPESVFDGAYFKVSFPATSPPSPFPPANMSFQAEMTFTDNYPYSPPTFKFLQPIYHPNIYTDGKLCISILHPPGEDEQSGELASERWSPLQGVESVLRSVLLLLDDPEISSPANVDAGVMYRDDRVQYNQKAKEAVEASKKNIPEGYTVPKTLETAPPAKVAEDEDFWVDSDAEDFGASDSSGEDFAMDDEDGEGQESEEDQDAEGEDEEIEE